MVQSARRGPKARMPEPRNWNERDTAIGFIRGDRNDAINNLARLLEAIGDGVNKDHTIAWPTSEDETSIGDAARPILNSGLLLRDGSTIRLSRHGKTWIADRHPALLIGILHAHVRFMGEILQEIDVKPISQNGLLRLACEKYTFAWTTVPPITNRVRWLEAAGFVSLYSHAVNITPSGRDLLGRLTIHRPEVTASSPTDLQPAPQTINDMVQKLSSDHRIRHRAGNCSISGVKGNPEGLDTILRLVDNCSSAIDETALVAKAEALLNTGPAAAEAAIRSLKIVGLLERASATEFVATPAAMSWVTSGYKIDLARIVQANVWYFSEIILELEMSGKLTFGELIERGPKYSISGHYPPMKRGALTGRVTLLEAIGLIVNVSKGVYKATPLGSAFRQSVPTIEPVSHASPPSVIPTKHETGTDLSPSVNTESVATVVQVGNEIAGRLELASKQSDKSIELERAAIEAFNFLGLPAVHIGGQGEPDGTVKTRPGQLGATYTVETKSAANGQVPEEQAKPATLFDHREQHDAEATVYVGPGFERRLLDVLDGDEKVAVVSTSLIAETVRRQPDTPLTPEELGPLIDPSLREADRRPRLLARWAEKNDWALAMRGVVEILAREAASPMSDEEFSSFGVGWLELTSVRRSVRDILNREVSREIIGEVLEFLSSPQLGIVEAIEDRYRLSVSSEAVGRHFEYLGRRWQLGDGYFAARVAP